MRKVTEKQFLTHVIIDITLILSMLELYIEKSMHDRYHKLLEDLHRAKSIEESCLPCKLVFPLFPPYTYDVPFGELTYRVHVLQKEPMVSTTYGASYSLALVTLPSKIPCHGDAINDTLCMLSSMLESNTDYTCTVPSRVEIHVD